MKHWNTLALATLTACLLSATAHAAEPRPPSAAAAPPGGFDPQLEFVVQRDLGIFPGQIPQYLQTERLATTSEPALQRALGRAYAGSWIERRNDGTFGYVVATTATGKAASTARAAAAGIEVRQVRHGLDELQASMARLDDLQARTADAKDAMRGIRAWRVDPMTNSVVVTVAPDATQRAIDFIAASGIDADQVRVEESALGLAPDATVRGGIRYDKFNGVWCSVAFAVWRGTQKGFVTAGHCGQRDQRVWIGGELVGAFKASRFPGSDRAWVRVDNQHTLAPWVKKGANAVAVRGRTRAPLGAAVCRSGAKTGYRCGRILAHDVTVHYQGGDTLRHMTESNACSGPGDSGGSWLTPSGQAQGVHSGGTISGDSSCDLPPSQRRTYYDRINPILEQYGLRLEVRN